MNRKSLALAVLLTPLAACTDPAEDPSEDALAARAFELDSGCGRWRCGYNAAEINGESLTELSVSGTANADGVKIVGFIAPLGLISYKLAVVDDKFVAKGGLLGNLTGIGLIGSTLLVKLGSGLVVPVIIAGLESVPSWADGAAPVTAYTLIYLDPQNPLGHSNVCTGSLTEPLTAAVTLIGGETYNNATKTVNPNMNGWFTLACAGSAAAKLKLMNYSPSSDFDGHGGHSTVMQRQATLKMITADYCGDGVSYTATGTPLLWANAEGTVSPDPESTVGEFEAAWTGSGASCLDTPRHPDLAASLHCQLPTCTAAHMAAGEWITINPAAE